MLKKRLITASLLIPMVLAILFILPPQVFGLITSLVVLAASWEWTNLMGMQRKAMRILYVVIMAAFLFNILFVPMHILLGAAFAWWMLALLMLMTYPQASAWWSRSQWKRGIMGILVMVPCWAALVFMRIQPQGIYQILFLFILIWGADSAAYFVGKKFGKHKLAPLISPGKSVEGVLAAILFALIFTWIALWWSETPSENKPWVLMVSFITVIFSVIGDLFESMMKRNMDLKDSGNLLPGHGGLLDRIDSLTAAAPVFALGALILGMYL